MVCVQCNQVITQPICPDCISREIEVMVRETDGELAKQIKGFDMPGDIQCLFCGKGMGLCAHCYSRDVYEFLLEKNPAIAEEFLEMFDFDLRRDFQ